MLTVFPVVRIEKLLAEAEDSWRTHRKGILATESHYQGTASED
jgi:hypothetical protein